MMPVCSTRRTKNSESLVKYYRKKLILTSIVLGSPCFYPNADDVLFRLIHSSVSIHT
jgi:hypothetical protein